MELTVCLWEQELIEFKSFKIQFEHINKIT